jgi:glycosyltransferase involved in cell wall biosynthesis
MTVPHQDKPDVSVVVITRNEAEVIEACIRSAAFAREVVLLDSGSTDGTCDTARRLGARVESADWPGDFSAQRNAADACATTSWVIQIDADETITEELAAEISAFFGAGRDKAFSAAQVPRREIMFGKWMRYGGWYPEYKVRLYRRGSGSWTGITHESYKTEGEIITFSHPTNHYSLKSIQVFIDKFNRYSTMEADADFRNGRKFSLAKAVFQPLERFIGRYIVKKGYKDGLHGFVVSALFALSYFLRNVKLWERHYQARNDDGA